MTGMRRSLVVSAIVVGAASLAGCGSGAKLTANYTTTPPTTVSGVGVKTSGPPPKPSTPTACSHRWNGAANIRGRAAAKHKAPKANEALIRTARGTGYFADDSGRCLVYLIARPSAVVFVETARGRFAFTAYATGHVPTNADFQQDGRLHLR